jgi:hypothetical protein
VRQFTNNEKSKRACLWNNDDKRYRHHKAKQTILRTVIFLIFLIFLIADASIMLIKKIMKITVRFVPQVQAFCRIVQIKFGLCNKYTLTLRLINE